jgi:hypothetical protein
LEPNPTNPVRWSVAPGAEMDGSELVSQRELGRGELARRCGELSRPGQAGGRHNPESAEERQFLAIANGVAR